MKKLLLYVTICFTCISYAQQSINYKAIIKDNNGNVVANSAVAVQFIISQGATQINVYQESHIATTDSNGLIILNIGEGTSSGVISDIDWSADITFLNTQINTGTGLVDLGTTQFNTVPYAKHADTAVEAKNVTGLVTLDEGNGIGWRLKGMNPLHYGNIGENAVDLSLNSYNSETNGAMGNYSIAMGYRTEALGPFSTTMGTSTRASGDFSTAMGHSSIASGSYSTAMGFVTTASGEFSTSLGERTLASSRGSLAIGRYNIGGGAPGSWVQTDPLFEVGNGDHLTKSNALTILKNGTITAPSFNIANITDNKALITKEYADLNLKPSGLESINEGNGIGWRLKGKNPQFYGNIGNHAIDLSYSNYYSETYGATGEYSIAIGDVATASGKSSLAIGELSTASGLYSSALGYNNKASGFKSLAIGASTVASGQYATTMGNTTKASGDNSTAIGFFSTASGYGSTAMGYNTNAASQYSLAIGKNNIGGGSPTTWVETDPLLEVGIGAAYNNKSNALTILKNGKIGIGTASPKTSLHISKGADATLANGTGYVIIGQESGDNVVFDNNEIQARNNGATSNLYLQHRGGNVWAGGALVHSSDRRLKKDITPLSYGLETILELNPVTYNWNNRTQNQKSIGLIAQEVEPIIGEIVHQDDDEAKTLSVSYIELIPVLINAIKELKEIINNQDSKINDLSAEIDQLKGINSKVK